MRARSSENAAAVGSRAPEPRKSLSSGLTSTKGDLARPPEDGFAVMLGEPSCKALRESLRSGRDLELLGEPGSMAIRVRWRD